MKETRLIHLNMQDCQHNCPAGPHQQLPLFRAAAVQGLSLEEGLLCHRQQCRFCPKVMLMACHLPYTAERGCTGLLAEGKLYRKSNRAGF